MPQGEQKDSGAVKNPVAVFTFWRTDTFSSSDF
jgi:hypothetical protein